MKTFKKTILVVLVSVLAFSISGVCAGSILKEVKGLSRSDVKLEVNGKPLVIRDANGKVKHPISYENIFYMPNDLISTQIGITSQWDEKQKVIRLNNLSTVDSSVKVFVNNIAFKPLDEKLSPLFPIKHKGKYYLPIEVVRQLGYAFNYNTQNNTLTIGDSSGFIPFDKACPYKFEGHGNNPEAGITKDKDLLTVNDTTFSHGVYAISPKYYDGISKDTYCPQLNLYTSNKYQTLSFSVGVAGTGNMRILVRNGERSSDTLLSQTYIKETEGVKNIQVDIGTSSVVSIRLIGDGSKSKIVIGDIKLR